MNRKLIAIAVGTALAAPAAIADVTVGGQVNLSYGSVDDEVVSGKRVDSSGIGTRNTDQYELNNQASRITFKGSEDLGNGLKANFFMEWGTNPDSGGGDGLSSRNQWVGLSGDTWGETRFGRHDTPLKFAQGKFDVFNDQFGDFANGRSRIVTGDQRVDNVLAYISPRWSGFGFAIAGIPGENDGGGQDSAVDLWSGNVQYANGPIFASVGYSDLDGDRQNIPGGSTEILDTILRVVGTYSFGAAQIGAMYELTEFEDDNATVGRSDEYDVWGVSGKYTFGNNVIKAMYHQGSVETKGAGSDDDDTTKWSVGFDHNFSKRTRVYAEYTDFEKETNNVAGNDDEFTFAGVGISHKF